MVIQGDLYFGETQPLLSFNFLCSVVCVCVCVCVCVAHVCVCVREGGREREREQYICYS